MADTAVEEAAPTSKDKAVAAVARQSDTQQQDSSDTAAAAPAAAQAPEITFKVFVIADTQGVPWEALGCCSAVDCTGMAMQLVLVAGCSSCLCPV